MSAALQIILAACAVLLTTGTLVMKSGMWAGRQEASKGDMDRIESEIKALRDWRHRIGDDPCAPVLALFNLLELRVSRLETRVFNGGPK